jgi:hypothetical protein
LAGIVWKDDKAVAAGSKERLAGSPTAHKRPELPRYFYRLTRPAQRIYLRSEGIDGFDFSPTPAVLIAHASLMAALEDAATSTVQGAAQRLATELCRVLSVPPVRVEVRGVRPRNGYGELHGIFYPRAKASTSANSYNGARRGEPLIVLWMRTAQRHDVVKPKTFVRTLMHELAHYFDYSLLKLGDSFHTSGFFKRESFLVRALFAAVREP